jgi:hypothetical protein
MILLRDGSTELPMLLEPDQPSFYSLSPCSEVVFAAVLPGTKQNSNLGVDIQGKPLLCNMCFLSVSLLSVYFTTFSSMGNRHLATNRSYPPFYLSKYPPVYFFAI